MVKQVDKKALDQLKWDFEIEERNMLLLRHPYLTLAQSHGHKKAMNPEPIKMEWEAEKIKKFSKSVTLEDRLMHLQVKDAWD